MRKNNKIKGCLNGTCCLLGGLLIWLSACVTDYEPEGIEQVRDLLVVDGIITNGETVVRLSRSVGLLEEFKEDEYVNNAKVVVEREDGVRYVASLITKKGEYGVTIGELAPGEKYRVHITVDGKEYASEYLMPLITPPIDTVSLLKAGQGQSVHLCVSTHDRSDASPCYRWTYKENWEVKAEMFATAGLEYVDGRETVVFYDLRTSNNIYYCWGKDSSKVMLLGNSDKLTENVISNKKLVTMEPSDKRLSILYHVEVAQYALRREAYDYYFNLQKNVEESGGLFSPIPSEMKGNIQCLSDPDVPVIGYVEVATVARVKRFLPEIKDVYEEKRMYCDIMEGMPQAGYSLLNYNPGGEITSALTRCVDCRRGGTKNKPSWWPNNHL